ncbi:MAG: Flp pilus assembly protein CpaB [Alphaproteobacteria bacterium]
MKPSRIAVLVIAVIAAGGSAMLAKGMISSRDTGPVTVAGPTLDTVDVLVAATDFEIGKVISGSVLKWQKWPKDAAQSQFITRKRQPDALKEMKGAIVRIGILAGEPINDTKLVRQGKSGFMSAILNKGMLAISTRISPETGAGGFILPNDYVDVILSRQQRSNDGGKEVFLSNTVLTNVRVLAIDQAVVEKDGKKVVVGKTATLELRPKQAETLALAESMGKIALALRSLQDAPGGVNGPKTADGFRGGRGVGTVTMVRYGVRSEVANLR